MLGNNIFALVSTFAIALVWLRLNYFTASRGWISVQVSRKIIHIGTGVFFVLCWLLFINSPSARYLAALVPFLFTLQFFLIGIGMIPGKTTVQAISRTGDRHEMLKGPLLYGIVFITLTILFWVDSPVGIVALMILCGGDGFADILGSRFGYKRLPWNKNKSWTGSLGMFLAGCFISIIMLEIFVSSGYFSPPIKLYYLPVVIVAGAATLIESLPISDIDNLTIALTTTILGTLLF